jgi:hypothetical protein
MSPPAGSPRRRQPSKKSSQPKNQPEPTTPGPASSSDSSASPLGLAGDPFVRPKDAPPAASAADLDKPAYEPPKPPPPEWDPERMEVVLKGLGYVLHAVDPVAGGPLSQDLWKLTEEDAKAIAGPATRIANRYATVRGAAGFSDEIGVAATLTPYVKKNLAERGRVKAATARDERPGLATYQPETERQPETPAPVASGQPESPQGSQPASQPGLRLAPRAGDPAGSSEPENPKAGVADAFEYALPVSDVHQPPLETDRG